MFENTSVQAAVEAALTELDRRVDVILSELGDGEDREQVRAEVARTMRDQLHAHRAARRPSPPWA